jgi:hypothetical protein
MKLCTIVMTGLVLVWGGICRLRESVDASQASRISVGRRVYQR